MNTQAKKILFMITIAAALALPVLVHFALGSEGRYQTLRLTLSKLLQQKSELVAYKTRLEQFRRHAVMAKQFSAAARKYGIGPENWDVHEVNIKQTFVAYPDFEGFIQDMAPSHDSYFVPKYLKIHSRPTVTYEDVAAAGGRGHVFAGGVNLSLKGEFLVEH